MLGTDSRKAYGSQPSFSSTGRDFLACSDDRVTPWNWPLYLTLGAFVASRLGLENTYYFLIPMFEFGTSLLHDVRDVETVRDRVLVVKRAVT